MKKKLPFLIILVFPIWLAQQHNLKLFLGKTQTALESLQAATQELLQPMVSKIFDEKTNRTNPQGFYQVYAAALEGGSIGQTPNFPVDDPFDNVFHINIPGGVSATDRVFLVYELKGVQDHTAVSRSINDAQSVGGYLIQEGKSWQLQKEEIKPQYLRKGDNVIRFSVPERADYRYNIRGLKLLVKKGVPNQIIDDIVVNQPAKIAYENQAYLKGFIRGDHMDKVQLFVDHQAVPLHRGEFECLINKPDSVGEKWTVQLKAVFPDRKTQVRWLTFENTPKAKFHQTLQPKGLTKTEFFTKNSAQQIEFQGLKLHVPAPALSLDRFLTVTALRDLDLPALGADLVNVTGVHRGFRLLPDGTQFQVPVLLNIPYDTTLIPAGYTEADIRTFYFDEADRRWKAVSKDTVFQHQDLLRSKTTHFTDYINGIIKVPESPQTQGYKPTEIKDLKAADPSNGITLIEPPSHNSMGTANIQFPIKIPAGRQGMQPQLAIQYNSEGGNGWLGIGWDLSIPSINIETRWGVPQFDPNLETETYLMGGQMLTPVAHRASPIARIRADRRFYPRIEGGFQKIIRHGTNPENYWWEVTSTDGTKNFYGGRPGAGVDNNAVLKDDKENIVQWCLRETKDLNGNFVRYRYDTVHDAGVRNGSKLGRQIYIDEISYTGFGQEDGKYKIKFIRDRQINDPKRLDAQINGRLGFKQVTADLLRELRVSYGEKLVRSYELLYKQGPFEKTLLNLILEKDAKKEEFYRYELDYWDEVRDDRGSYQPYRPSQAWEVPEDGLDGGLINPLPGFEDDISALGGSTSFNYGVSGALSFGFGFSNDKQLTIGGHYSYSKVKNDGKVALIDITGDGLPDKVFCKDGAMFYERNLSPFRKFAPKRKILNVNEFSHSETTTHSYGFDADFYIHLGWDKAKSKTFTDVYMSDFNSDRLMDVVINQEVWFNHLNENGDPVFTKKSSDTPYKIVAGAPLDTSVLAFDPTEQAALIEENPLHDVVRMWKPPFKGRITIKTKTQLVQNLPGAQAYLQKDGVRVSIEHHHKNGADSLWKQTILPNSTTVYQPIKPGLNGQSIAVDTSDHLYFRIHSRFDGAYDQVIWDPEIEYLSIDPIVTNNELDPHNRPIHRYKASEDFVLGMGQAVGLEFAGSIEFKGTLSKPVTSDSITVLVLKTDKQATRIDTLYAEGFNWSTALDSFVFSLNNKQVNAGDQLSTQIKTTTNIDWSALKLDAHLHYVSAINQDGNPIVSNSKPLIEFNPSPEFTMLNYLQRKGTVFQASNPGRLKVKPQFNVPLNIQMDLKRKKVTFELTLSVKGLNKLYGKKTFKVFADSISVNVNPEIVADIPANEPIWVEYHIPSRGKADSIAKSYLFLDAKFDGNGVPIQASIFTALSEKEFIFGPLYRGWGQFAYFANGRQGVEVIDRKLLKINDKLKNPPTEEEMKSVDNPDNIPSTYEASKDTFIMMFPNAKQKIWLGYDESTWVSADTISSSRMGDDDVRLVFIPPAGSSELQSPRLTSVSTSKTRSGGTSIGIGGFGVGTSGSESSTTSTTKVSVMDISGDGFPDIIGPDSLQLTTYLGGRAGKPIAHSLGNHVGTSTSKGSQTSGGYTAASGKNSESSGKGSPRISIGGIAVVNGNNTAAQSASQSASTSVGISGNASYNTTSDATEHTWLDINGDGLADKLYRNGDVQLNLGYRFSPRENWGFNEIRTGESKDFGAGVGASFGGAYSIFSFSFSGGVSVNKSESQANRALQDINGDGLIDIIETGNPMQVRFNTGGGFTNPVKWNGSTEFDTNKSIGEGANASFTACVFIPLWVITLKICLTPGGSIGHSVASTQLQISDVDGDGFPDVLTSNDDSELNVHSSSIRRTNLLKTVHNPLGGSFTLDYDLTPNTYDMPSSKWVLASVETNDGLNGDGADRSKVSFDYSDGKYSRRERDFYGFNQVIAKELDTENRDAVYRTRTYTYLNSNYYNKGLMTQEIMTDAKGEKYTETINHFELLDGILMDPFSNPNTNEIGIAFPALKKTENRFYEGQTTPGLNKVTTFEYDEFGNVVKFTDFGDGSTGDLLMAKIQYAHFPDNYLHAIPNSIEVLDAASKTHRKRKATVTEQGDVEKIEQWIGGNTWAEYLMEYDDFGNLTKLTRPENYQKKIMFYAYEYDTEVNTYVSKVKDAYGYVSTSKYDLAFGVVVESQDINGQIIRYALDPKGRIATIISPYEVRTGKDYTIKFEYFPAAPVSYAKTTHYDQDNPDKGILTYTFMDGLQRPIQVKKSGSIFTSEGSNDQEALIVSGKIMYDAFGRSVATHYPIVDRGRDSEYNANRNEVDPVRKTFDVLDRELKVTLPDGAATTMEYSIISGACTCFKTLITDALGTQKEEWKDIRERTRTNIDHGPPVLTTTYHYNAISDLLKVVDTGGNELEYTYDQLGRKLSMEHPDAGKTEFEYDKVGNLLKKITPNIRTTFPGGSAIQYTYDYERLVQIDYPQNYQNRVVYQYGEPGAPFNRAGRIWLQEDATGGQEFFYGPLGEVIKNIRTVLVNETTELTFVWENEYDSWNRIQKMKYPDLEEVSYEYNRAGKLKQVNSLKARVPYTLVEQVGYDEFEQRVFLKYGNGTKNTYTFEKERRRLTQLLATDRVGTNFMNKRYSYDAVDNISAVQNLATGNLVTLGGATRHTYTYDKLYRLTAAEGAYNKLGKSYAYTLQMEYDDLHNIRSKTQRHSYNGKDQAAKTYDLEYTYKAAKPHQAVQIGTKNYTYDPSGNQTGWSIPGDVKRREVYWDEENRISHIHGNGYMHLFTYDAAGERVLKSEGGIQALFLDGGLAGPVAHEDNYTAYISPYLVYKADKFTKHYYIESQRILSKIGTGDFYANRLPSGQGITAGNKDYSQRKTGLQVAFKKFLDDQGINPSEPSLGIRQQELIKKGIPIPNLDPDSYNRAPRNWPQPQARRQDSLCMPPISSIARDSFTNAEVTAGYGFVTSAYVQETNHFYYHPDHLGSTNFITDIGGVVRQFAEYIPYGETLVEEHTSTDTQPYLFNAKEYDDGTGLYYYGARYYDPVASIWVSVDPLMEKYPGWSPYNYTMLNPVKYVDPDGRASTNYMQILEVVSDFSSGFGGAISGGLTDRINEMVGNDAVINKQSSASQVGQLAGTVYNTALEITPGGGALKTTLKYMGKASNAITLAKDGYKAFHGAVTGNAKEAFEGVMGLSKSGAKEVAKRAMGKDGMNLGKPESKLFGGLFSQGLENFINAVTPKDNGRKFEPDKKGINFGIVQGRPTSLIDQVRGQPRQVSKE